MTTRAALLTLLISEVNAAGGVNKFARRSGVSNCLVSKTLRGLVEPDEVIANALGFVKRVEFVAMTDLHQ
jgi:DNA-binding phage protein